MMRFSCIVLHLGDTWWIQRWQKVYLRFGAYRWWCLCKHTHARWVQGHAPPEKKNFKLGVLKSLLRPYLNPNTTSQTRVHGGSNTAVHHNTCQSSRGVSLTIGCVGPASYRQSDNLDKNSFYFVLHFKTSSVITRCKSNHKGHHAYWTARRGAPYVAKSHQGGHVPLVPLVPPLVPLPMMYCINMYGGHSWSAAAA